MSERAGNLPRHLAIIMDGNGRWASRRGLPRQAGHRAGVKAARGIVRACGQQNIGALTLFAFSSENWNRPPAEVTFLMRLFVEALQREVTELHENRVQLKFIGERSALDKSLHDQILHGEKLPAANTGLRLNIAVAYGGRWDSVQAARRIAVDVAEGVLDVDTVDEPQLAARLSLADLPDPDLFIRTGGEQRVSNFLMWNLAYTELYFSDLLWPDFDVDALNSAFEWYAARERRFGRVVAEPDEPQRRRS